MLLLICLRSPYAYCPLEVLTEVYLVSTLDVSLQLGSILLEMVKHASVYHFSHHPALGTLRFAVLSDSLPTRRRVSPLTHNARLKVVTQPALHHLRA